jgi:hypothetical protein
MTSAVLAYAGQAAETRPGVYAPEQPHVHVGAGAVPSPVAQAGQAGQPIAPSTLPGAGTPGSEA